MVLSMTGFGKSTAEFQSKKVDIEVKTLNSKTTDVRLKIPQHYREKEMEIRKILIQKLVRGKIEANITIVSDSGDEEYELNLSVIKKYASQLHNLSKDLDLPNAQVLAPILRMSNAVMPSKELVSEEEWQFSKKYINEAIDKVNNFRTIEGKSIYEDLKERVESILKLLEEIQPYEDERMLKVRAKLEKTLGELNKEMEVDRNRFEQELIYYLEKLDFSEEKVRLKQHCLYFLENLESTDSSIKGRTLNFICQEIGREINTLGSKAQFSSIQRVVIQMKDDLEKIKEQLANAL